MGYPPSPETAFDAQRSFYDDLADRRRTARMDAAELLAWIGTRLREAERRHERLRDTPDGLTTILSEGALLELRIHRDVLREATTALATGGPLPPSFSLRLEWIEIDDPEAEIRPAIIRLLRGIGNR